MATLGELIINCTLFLSPFLDIPVESDALLAKEFVVELAVGTMYPLVGAASIVEEG